MVKNEDNATDLVTAIPQNLEGKVCSGTYNLKVTSYAGTINVDRQKENNLYYWFFESLTSNPTNLTDIPVVIWLNGGPGASSLAGLFLENGPFLLKDTGDNKAQITDNENGWNQKTHLMYWDQPVGTGFSYTGTDSYAKSEDELSEQFFNALQGFFALHPDYRACDLYLTGESYAGKYIPNMAKMIKDKNESLSDNQKINLKGLALGDGWMYPQLQTNLQVDYGYEMGFIDTLQKNTAETLYQEYSDAMDRKDMTAAFNLGNNVSKLILYCGGNPDIYDVRRWSDLPIQNLKDYLACDNVKNAIHAKVDWQFADANSTVADNLMDDLEADVTALFPELIEEYRMLFYTGNFDMSCGYTGTEQILQSWNYEQKWRGLIRKVWTMEQPAGTGDLPLTLGFVKGIDGLSQIVIPDSGHQVPVSKPMVSLLMINNWIFKQEYTGYLPTTVQAKIKWVDTGIAISEDVKTTVRYLSGTWSANPETGFVDADGKTDLIAKDGYTLPGANEGALCGRVGPTGDVFLIGKKNDISNGLSGNLFLCINDDLSGQYGKGFADNEGSVTVAVIIV